MTHEILAPKTGLTAETVEIVEWYKSEGDAIEQGENILAIETEKVVMEVEAPCSGYLVKISAQPGDTVAISEVIGLIGDTPEDA